jgi:hypothetical protein
LITRKKVLDNIAWYADPHAREKGEPGIQHSFMKSLATALHYVRNDLDPAWLMGSSAFAFRTYANEILCPSAMSVFDFSAILPEAIEQSGHRAVYVYRYWNDEANEEARRKESQAAIVAGIDRGAPAVVWDVFDAEWGLIVGYDLDEKRYQTLTHRGDKFVLPFDRLGRNGIDILSVSIPGPPNERIRNEIILNSLKAAAVHADQGEWTDRPHYQNGLAAYDLWSSCYEKAALIVDAGGVHNIKQDFWDHAAYYANHHYSARCYARDYLKMIAAGDKSLEKAASCYEMAATLLRPVWHDTVINLNLDADAVRSSAQKMKEAKVAEEKGVMHIKAFLQR